MREAGGTRRGTLGVPKRKKEKRKREERKKKRERESDTRTEEAITAASDLKLADLARHRGVFPINPTSPPLPPSVRPPPSRRGRHLNSADSEQTDGSPSQYRRSRASDGGAAGCVRFPALPAPPRRHDCIDHRWRGWDTHVYSRRHVNGESRSGSHLHPRSSPPHFRTRSRLLRKLPPAPLPPPPHPAARAGFAKQFAAVGSWSARFRPPRSAFPGGRGGRREGGKGVEG